MMSVSHLAGNKKRFGIYAKPLFSFIFLVTFLRLSLQFIAEDDTHHDADDADDQTAEHGGPETVYAETDAKALRDSASEQKHDRIDDDGEQAQREDDERAGEELQQWPHQRVQQADDERKPQDVCP